MGNCGCMIRVGAYGPWFVRGRKKPNLDREKTRKCEEPTPLPGQWEWCGGSIRHGGVIASDVADAVRIEDFRAVKIPHYDVNPAKLDDFILGWEDFAEEVVGEMWFGTDT